MLREIDRAARRQYCDWDLVTRAREEGIGMLVPDIQSFRMVAPMLAVRARFDLADGQFDPAARGLQTGFSLGRHLADSTTLIQSLVATAITSTMLDQVEEWIRTPDSPNLYWALTTLPQPFIDLHKPYQGERLIIDNLLPGFREALAQRFVEPMSAATLDALRQKLGMLADQEVSSALSMIVVMKKYTAAKQYLQSQGWTSEAVESLPAMQAVLLAEVATYDRLYDEMIKWGVVPYVTARTGFDQAENLLKKEVVAAGSPASSLAGLLIPATIKVAGAANRIDRRIAGLRCLEAIRLHAAEHDRLPATLAEIKEVPVPVNPTTGEPFSYTSDGATATLEIPSPAAMNSIKYVITIRK